MDNQKNVFIVCLLCMMIWLSSELWLKPKEVPPPLTTQVDMTTSSGAVVKKVDDKASLVLPRIDALKQSSRIAIRTPLLKGSIRLRGACLDDLILLSYHQTSSANSPAVSVLSPKETAQGYYAYFLWYGSDSSLSLPTESTLWTADQEELTPNQPVTLTVDNEQGLRFQQTFSIDKNYMVSVRQTVTNTSKQTMALGVRGLIDRKGPVETSGYMVLYEGPLGVFNARLKEISYKDCSLPEEQTLRDLGADTRGQGWLGITDKYWLTALIPSAEQTAQGRFSGTQTLYRTESMGALQQMDSGDSYSTTTHLFSGPKQLNILDQYEEKYHINHFDLAVDFGWFYFLTKPMFYLLSWLKQMCGSFGLAILVMTVMVKVLFFPLALRSHRSMAGMRALQPKMQVLKDTFKDDRMRLNEEMMALYKKEKINPASGCLPMLVQIPVFFALYKVLFISIEMRHAPFLGWIRDLSSPDPTSLFNLFGLLSWTLPEYLHVGAWPLLMGLSMYLQQRINGLPSADPTQRFMFLYIMPVMFSYMMANFPVGLVIYWTWSNLLTLFQQWFISNRSSKEVQAP